MATLRQHEISRLRQCSVLRMSYVVVDESGIIEEPWRRDAKAPQFRYFHGSSGQEPRSLERDPRFRGAFVYFCFILLCPVYFILILLFWSAQYCYVLHPHSPLLLYTSRDSPWKNWKSRKSKSSAQNVKRGSRYTRGAHLVGTADGRTPLINIEEDR